jgi:hypothetical protein
MFIADPRSGFFPSRIPDPGVKKAPAPGSGSATLIGRMLEYVVTNAVFADSGCLSRIPNPDNYPSRILDPVSNSSSKRGRGKKEKFPPILFCNKYLKIVNILFLHR